MRIYLAGPIFGCTDPQVAQWRGLVKYSLQCYGYEFHNPAERDYRGREADAYREIVEADKAAIRDCGLLLAYCWQPSYGTAMEIQFAHTEGIPAVAVCAEPVSPWLRYHAEVFPGLGDAIIALAGRAGANR